MSRYAPRMGMLYNGDNFDCLRRCHRDATMDLVYLDPAFNSAQDGNFILAKSECQT